MPFIALAAPQGNTVQVELSQADKTIDVDPGAKLHILQRTVNDFPFAVYVLEMGRSKFVGSIVVPEKIEGESVRDFLMSDKGVVAINGGFLGSYSPPTPTGLLRQNGAERSPLGPTDPVADGILCVGDQAAHIYSRNDLGLARGERDCLQTGPLLVRGTKPSLNRGIDFELQRKFGYVAGKIERSFVATDKDRLLVGVTTAIDLASLATLLAAPETAGGLGISDAIALPGKRAAAIVYRANGEIKQFGDGGFPMPDAIIFRKNPSR
jgi:Phosphodiester glycosidase